MNRNYILLPNGGFVGEDELYHYGTKGMKWGVRRYQNKDGSLTPVGKKRYKSDTDMQVAKNKTVAELMRNRRIVEDYVKETRTNGMNSPNAIRLRDRYRKSTKELTNLAKNYLSTLPAGEAKKIIKFDEEHGRRYVDVYSIDSKVAHAYEDWIYLD